MKLKAIAAAALAAPLMVACGSTESAKAPYTLNGAGAVSYTHLTLPTTPYV